MGRGLFRMSGPLNFTPHSDADRVQQALKKQLQRYNCAIHITVLLL